MSRLCSRRRAARVVASRRPVTCDGHPDVGGCRGGRCTKKGGALGTAANQGNDGLVGASTGGKAGRVAGKVWAGSGSGCWRDRGVRGCGVRSACARRAAEGGRTEVAVEGRDALGICGREVAPRRGAATGARCAPTEGAATGARGAPTEGRGYRGDVANGGPVAGARVRPPRARFIGFEHWSRFSRRARMPSRASLEVRASSTSAATSPCGMPSRNAISRTRRAFIARSESGALAASRSMTALATTFSPSGGATRAISPSACMRSAGIGSPSKRISRAATGPPTSSSFFARNHVGARPIARDCDSRLRRRDDEVPCKASSLPPAMRPRRPNHRHG